MTLNLDFRSNLAAAWQARANLTRSSIFGDQETLLPIQNKLDAMTAAPGYVGEAYEPGGLVIVSINPAGGKDGAHNSPSDRELYGSFRHLRDSVEQPPVADFEILNRIWAQQMPRWSVFQQHTGKILQALSMGVQQIAYVYVVPFRTRGDVAAKIKPQMRDRALPSFLQQIDALSPGKLVSMDRMAEAACNVWAAQQSAQIRHWYFTRKRDAHGVRAATLQAMSDSVATP